MSEFSDVRNVFERMKILTCKDKKLTCRVKELETLSIMSQKQI